MHARPLLHKRIVLTRAERQAKSLLARLRALGAEPILCPAVAFAPPASWAPLDGAIDAIDSYDWLVFTSANGVAGLLDRMRERGVDAAPLTAKKIAAVGAATADVLTQHGLAARSVPNAYVAEALLETLGDVRGQRVLLPRADIARDVLPAGLRERGAAVDDVVAYRTVPGDGVGALVEQLRSGAVDALTFTSSSTVRYLLDGLEAAGLARTEALPLLNAAVIACIGPVTASTARDEGLRVDVEAAEHTAEGLVSALVAWYAPGARES